MVESYENKSNKIPTHSTDAQLNENEIWFFPWVDFGNEKVSLSGKNTKAYLNREHGLLSIWCIIRKY